MHFAEIKVKLVHPPLGTEKENAGTEKEGEDANHLVRVPPKEGGGGGGGAGAGDDYDDLSLEEEGYYDIMDNPAEYNRHMLQNQKPMKIIIPHITVFFL